MDDDLKRGPAGQARRPPGRRRPPGSRPHFEDEEDEYPRESADDPGEDAEVDERPARRPAPRRGTRTAPPKKKKSSVWSLFGGGKKQQPRRRPGRGGGGGGMDWDSVQEDEEAGYGDARYEEEAGGYEDRRPRRRQAPPREGKRRERLTLMELCTPVFGYAAVLPRDTGGVQPGYQQFRQEVLNALQKIESEAPQHGVEREDAARAIHALSLFMDEQVAESEWTAKMQWLNEPLSIVKLQDPEGGITFFTYLDQLGDRQKAVKEVYLVCLALGFRGKYAELDLTQQAAKIAEVRQKLLRSIHPTPLESRELLFPEAYVEAAPLEDESPAPPRWWIAASLGTVAAAILIYIILFWSAGNLPHSAEETLRPLRSGEVTR